MNINCNINRILAANPEHTQKIRKLCVMYQSPAEILSGEIIFFVTYLYAFLNKFENGIRFLRLNKRYSLLGVKHLSFEKFNTKLCMCV